MVIPSEPASALESALDAFKTKMLEKFRARAVKHGDRSVTIAGATYLHDDGVIRGLWRHFGAEVDKFRRADRDTQNEMDEAVDVANMAFLIWWKDTGMP